MRLIKAIALVFALVLMIAGCKPEPQENTVEIGSTVIFDYAAGFDNGTLFDTSFEEAARQAGIYDPMRDYTPERAVIGQDPLLPALAEAMLGMKVGEAKNIRLVPEQAYGRKMENSTRIIERIMLSNPNASVGEIVIITLEGKNIAAFVAETNEENVNVDLNHPLAGEAIRFAVIVRAIE